MEDSNTLKAVVRHLITRIESLKVEIKAEKEYILSYRFDMDDSSVRCLEARMEELISQKIKIEKWAKMCRKV